MVDTFHFGWGLLYGSDAVENLLSRPGARALCAGRSESSHSLCCPLPLVRHQPAVWLQVAAAFPAGRARRLAQPLAPSTPLAQTPAAPLAPDRAPPPPALPALGGQKNPRPLAPQVSPRSRASRAHHY